MEEYKSYPSYESYPTYLPTGLTIGNEVISASAGSGKTFQLTNRYINLLFNGVPPERIIALTFTKKAAGEIFDKIIDKLWTWHEMYDVLEIKKQITEAGLNGIGRDKLLALLKKVIFSQDRIRISTIDSFFVNILQCFPMEFGVDSAFEITDEYLDRQNKEAVLKQILYAKDDSYDRKNFLEQFKKACYGKEAKSIRDTLDGFIDSCLYNYMLFTSDASWGIPGMDSGKGTISSTPEYIQEVATLMQEKKDCFNRVTPKSVRKLTVGQMEKMEQFLIEAGSFVPASEFSKSADEIFTEILNNGYSYNSENYRQEPSLKKLTEYLLRCHFIKYSMRSAGIHSILDKYNATYDELVRKNGYLSFTDITWILNGGKNKMHPVLSGTAGNGAGSKLYVDLRLDSHFSHWLIDEFQDTSRLQWNVIENLIDEVMNDPAGKSFFYVGDVKQAIYGWRGGDSQLFGMIREKYNDRLFKRELNETRRSSPEIVETVRDVFLKLIDNQIAGIPSETSTRWKKAWGGEEYRTTVTKHGYSELLEITEERNSSETIICEVVSKIKEIDPISRGLSTGILVLTNEKGREFAAELKKAGIPVSLDGNFGLTDSPAVNILLSLVKLAQHPADTLSFNHLLMFPFDETINGQISSHTEDFILSLLEEISASGFSGLIKKWAFNMKSCVRMNDFDSGRIEKMILAAETFDVSANRNCMDFINYIECYSIPATASKKAVQVMTIYKAKGLEFDMVFLPDLKESHANMVEKPIHDGLNTMSGNVGMPAGFCSLLPKRDISTADPEIKKYVEWIDSEYCYERFCCLYVAMTRAKRALYMYIPSQKTETVYTSTVLRNTLRGGVGAISGNEKNEYPVLNKEHRISRENPTTETGGNSGNIIYERGDEKWYQDYTPDIVSGKKSEKKVIEIKLKSAREVDKETPSEDHNISGPSFCIRDIFDSADSRQYAEIGTCVHYMFEKIDYLNVRGEDIKFTGYDRSVFEEKIWNTAYDIFKKGIADESIAGQLSKNTSDKAVLWKEKAFSVILEDGKLLSGQFDRVEIIKDAEGKIQRAGIIDFKCENPTIPEAQIISRYSHQMLSYRTALSKILKIHPGLINMSLLLLNRLSVVKIEDRNLIIEN